MPLHISLPPFPLTQPLTRWRVRERALADHRSKVFPGSLQVTPRIPPRLKSDRESRGASPAVAFNVEIFIFEDSLQMQTLAPKYRGFISINRGMFSQ